MSVGCGDVGHACVGGARLPRRPCAGEVRAGGAWEVRVLPQAALRLPYERGTWGMRAWGVGGARLPRRPCVRGVCVRGVWGACVLPQAALRLPYERGVWGGRGAGVGGARLPRRPRAGYACGGCGGGVACVGCGACVGRVWEVPACLEDPTQNVPFVAGSEKFCQSLRENLLNC